MLREWIDYWIIRMSNKFDRYYYLSLNSDVLKEGVDPIRHYILHGAAEGRNPNREFNTLEYVRLNPGFNPKKINPFVHFLTRNREYQPQLQESFHPRQSEKADQSHANGNRITFEDILIRLLLTDHKLNYPYDEDEINAIGTMQSNQVTLAKKYAPYEQDTLVSIIMPTFNRAHIIMDSINSALAQSYKNWELLVIDDASTDDTFEIIARINDPRIRYIRNPENLGAAGTRNVGLDNARGGYICYLDSDNQMHPNFLLIMVNELRQRSNFDILYCAQRLIRASEGKNEEEGITFTVFHRPTLENYNYIDLGTMIHRASAVDQIRFDPELKVLIDWDFLLQLTRNKPAYGVMCILSDYYINKTTDQITAVQRTDLSLDHVDKKHFVSIHNRLDVPSQFVETDRLFSPEATLTHFPPKPISIVIPSYECLDYLELCVQSIEKFTRSIDYELIIVDNHSSHEVVQYLQSLNHQNGVRVIFNSQNVGFTGAVNQGIRAAKGENDIILLNNDTVVTRNWVEALQEVVGKYPQAGLVVPSQVLLPGDGTMQIHRPKCVITREIDVNPSLHHWNVVNPLFDIENGYMEMSFAPFFCVYIPRTTIDMVGDLDDKYGAHYYSDRFYCHILRFHYGRRIIYTPKSKVYHFVQQSTRTLSDADRYKLSQMTDKGWIQGKRG